MQIKVEEYLEEYNNATKNPMRLVMFLDACDHVARISRVLRQPMGNALLLGVGGSGRQSLCRLAVSINAF
jgi:dynein heavy chain, axonemal